MIWLAEARGRLSALSGVIRNCTHKNQDTPGKLVGNKQGRFVLILYSCIWRWSHIYFWDIFEKLTLMLESTWAGAPPSTCNILNHLKSLRASGLCLWWVGIGLRLFRGLSGWVGGAGGAGLHSLGLPIFPDVMSHLWQCLREGGRDSPASLSPVILILCVHNLRHLSKVNSLHLWHTLWHSLGLSLYQQGLLKVHFGPTSFSPLSRVSHWQPITAHFTHLSAVCWLFWNCTDIHLGNCINRSAKIVINVNKSNRCTATLAEYVTKHCRFAQIHNIVDRIMLLTWLRFTKY